MIQYLLNLFNLLELLIRKLIIFITNYLPVKVIRDDRGIPFLYRYHLFALTNDGPGMCIHHFVNSDPDRGYHDHPWNKALSFILCGRYEERILDLTNKKEFTTYKRERWNFNYLRGEGTFHRVMIGEKEDAWTLFAFGRRRKIWGMIGLDGQYKQMSQTVSDGDGGWWRYLGLGYGVDHHVKHPGNVIATVDTVVIASNTKSSGVSKVLLIKRGKEPYKGMWAFPGGRIEEKDEDTLSAAVRELKEETNLDADQHDIDLEYVTSVGNNTRDPRGFCLTSVFLVKLDEIPKGIKAGDDAVNYEWFALDDLPDMAFDHKDILSGMKI
jgi:8-oxo-dGTP diphosphatase